MKTLIKNQEDIKEIDPKLVEGILDLAVNYLNKNKDDPIEACAALTYCIAGILNGIDVKADPIKTADTFKEILLLWLGKEETHSIVFEKFN